MKNIHHSSESPNWYTPVDIVDAARKTMGNIILDPASDPEANKTIQAKHIFTKRDDGLAQDWMVDWNTTILLNPPGGKIDNKSVAWYFWDKLMSYVNHPKFDSAIFIGFNTSILRTSQQSLYCCMDFPICYPKERIRFVKPNEEKNSPSHDNVIVLVTGQDDRIAELQDNFINNFSKFGKIKL